MSCLGRFLKGYGITFTPSGEVFTDSPKQEEVVMAIDLTKHRDASPISGVPSTLPCLHFCTEPQDRQMLGILLFCWHPKAHNHTT